MLGQVLGETVQLGGKVDQVPPGRGVHLVAKLGEGQHFRGHISGVVGADPFSELVHLLLGQSQGFAQVSNGSLHLVGADHAGQRGVVPTVLLMHPQNQLFPNIAGKIQVNVGNHGHFAGQKSV